MPEESTPLQAALPVDSYATFAHAPAGLPATLEPNPDDPPWGLGAAVLMWVASVIFLLIVPVLFAVPYLLYLGWNEGFSEVGKILPTDKTLIVVSILGIIPAHLFTIAAVWALVTGFGKRPFWRTLGWSWGRNFGFWTSAGLAVALLALGWALTLLFGGEKTQIDQIIASSTAARYAIAILAVATAPLIEEIIYRGVLYSALQRLTGAIWAVVAVSVLFAVVHISQYSTNLGVIAAVSILSISLTIVRAYTGRLLPCFIIHLIFNGVQSVLIILHPYIERFDASGEEQKTALVMTLARALNTLI